MQIHFQLAQQNDEELIINGLIEAAKWLEIKQINHWQHWLDPSEELRNEIKASTSAKEFYLVYNQKHEFLAAFRQIMSDKKYWPNKNDSASYLHSFFVKRRFHGLNIGSSILKKIESRLFDQGISYFRLDCLESNQGLCKYYERQGFVKVGKIKDQHVFNALYEKKI